MTPAAPGPASRTEPAAEAWLAALLGTDRQAIALIDTHLRYVRVNRLLSAIQGRAVEEYAGREVREMIPPPWADKIEQLLRQVLATREPLYGYPLEGTRVRAYITVLPAWSEGELVGLAVLATDVAARLSEDRLAREIEFETFLIDLSRRFIDAPSGEVRASIDQVIEALGLALEVDLLEVREEGEVCRHRWSRLRDSSIGEAPAWARARVAAGETVFVPSAEALPEEAGERGGLGGARALGVVPMQIAGVVLGSVVFASERPGRPWAPLLVRRFQVIGEVLANALNRARIDEEIGERRAFDEGVSQEATRLVAADTDAIEAELGAALDRLRGLMGARRITVGWLDADQRTGRHLYNSGGTLVFAPGERFELRDFSERAMRELQAGRITQVSIDETKPKVAEAWGRAGMRQVLVVPMVVSGRTVGWLAFHGDEEESSAELRRRGELVASLVAHVLARREAEQAQRASFRELSELKARAERERDYLREELHQAHDLHQIVAESPALWRVLEAVAAVAPTNATVLVRGETGVGKELVARAIHARSQRSDRPLVKVNCATVPRELFESEFFGHVKGSFSGAVRDRQGRFELADKGTLFLDEIGELPLDMQSKLLRVLQEGEFERVGDDRTRKVDVRIVAATNRNLARDVQEGRFRRDLYYRLSVFPIEVPPLRQRPEDIGPLARHFLRRFAQQLGRPALDLTPAQLDLLLNYDWPGNVRELAHVIERAVILSPQPPLLLDLPSLLRPSIPPAPLSPTRPFRAASPLPPPPPDPSPRPPSSPGPSSAPPSSVGASRVRTAAELKDLERSNILAALEQSGGQVGGKGGAAEVLGLSPSTLRDRMKALGIDAQRPSRRR